MMRKIIGLVTLVSAFAAGVALGLDASASQQDLEILRGAIAREGRTDVDITVTNARGRATRTLTIVGGRDALALTPPRTSPARFVCRNTKRVHRRYSVRSDRVLPLRC